MEEKPSGLPVLRSSDQAVQPGDAFELYHDTNAPVLDTSLPRAGGRFRMEVVDYLVDDVVVTRLDTGPHSMRRAAHHLRDGTTDWITVQVHHTGGLSGAAGRDTTLDLGPGRLGILDLSEPIAAWSQGGVSTWVSLPRSRILDADRLPAVSALESSSLRGAMLQAAVADLWRRLPSARADEADALAADIAETVNTALVDGFVPTDRDLAVAMRDFIKVNLGDLDLDVDTLRSRFHCSRATAYRLFASQGGVAAYVREQRLLRCFDELTRPAKLPRTISEVATRWGFENASHFNRLFKSKFGLPPSGLAPSADDHQPSPRQTAAATYIDRFHSWAVAS